MAKLELRVEFPPNSAPRVFAQPRPPDIVYTRISLILSNITTINPFPLLSHSNSNSLGTRLSAAVSPFQVSART